MKYLIDKVNQEEAKRIYEIIDFFENNPTITRENVNTSHKMLIKFNDLMQKYNNSSENLLVSYRMLCIHQMKWDSELFCSYPAAKLNEDSIIYMKNVAFGEEHDHIIQLEKTSKQVEQMLQEHLNSRRFLVIISNEIKSFFKK